MTTELNKNDEPFKILVKKFTNTRYKDPKLAIYYFFKSNNNEVILYRYIDYEKNIDMSYYENITFEKVISHSNKNNPRVKRIYKIKKLEYVLFAFDENSSEFNDMILAIDKCVCCGSDHSMNNIEVIFQCKKCKDSKITSEVFEKATLNVKKMKNVKTNKTNVKFKGGHPARDPRCKDKGEQTSYNKYGTAHPQQSEVVKAKGIATNLEKRGVKHVFQCPNVQDEIKKTHMESRGVINPGQCAEVKAKIAGTKAKNPGGIFAPEKSIERILADKFQIKIEEFENILINDLENGLSLDEIVELYGFSKTGLTTCKKLNKFQEKFRELYGKNGQSQSELYVYNVLVNSIFNDNVDIFEQNKRSLSFLPSNKFEIDIFSESQKLAIEFNGFYWHRSLESQRKDKLKAQLCRENGYKFLAINELDLIDKSRLTKIFNLIKPNKISIGARKCEIREINSREIKDFLNKHHLQGHKSGKLNIGLYYNEELIQIMNFGKGRFNKKQKYTWELLRLATHSDYIIQGGSKKLWKYFEDNYLQKGDTVVSYCDIRYFSGDVYEKLGFKYQSHSFNYVWLNGETVLQRYQTQKHKLKTLLSESFDSNLSETENMENNGWIKVNLLGNDSWLFTK